MATISQDKKVLVDHVNKILHRAADAIRKVGGKTVCVGKRLLRWTVLQLGRFPSTVAAAVVIAVLIVAFGQIPFLGQLLLPVALLFGATLLGYVFLKELFMGLNRERADKR